MKAERAAILFVVGLTVAAGCGDTASNTSSASATASSKPTAVTTRAKPPSDDVPPVSIDDTGPFVNGERADLKDQPGRDRLHALVHRASDQGREVTLTILKRAKVPDVTAVVHELGLAGAPTIRISYSEGRKDLPKELVVVPSSKLTDKPPPCSVVAMVEKDISTSVWSIQGGAGKKHDKGLAGPDLGNAGETLEKEIKKCDSTFAFFSAAPTLNWELAHEIGGAVIANDKEKKLKTLVFIEETRKLPGRPVTLSP